MNKWSSNELTRMIHNSVFTEFTTFRIKPQPRVWSYTLKSDIITIQRLLNSPGPCEFKHHFSGLWKDAFLAIWIELMTLCRCIQMCCSGVFITAQHYTEMGRLSHLTPTVMMITLSMAFTTLWQTPLKLSGIWVRCDLSKANEKNKSNRHYFGTV